MSLTLSDEAFITSFIVRCEFIERAIQLEAPEDVKERNLRFSLAQHLFGALLGWMTMKGYGHYVVRTEPSIALYDQESLVVIVETRSPDNQITDTDEHRFRNRLLNEDKVRYGVLSNWHRLILDEREGHGKWDTLLDMNVSRVVQKGALRLTQEERTQILKLRRLERWRFVSIKDRFDQRRKQLTALSLDMYRSKGERISRNIPVDSPRDYWRYRDIHSYHPVILKDKRKGEEGIITRTFSTIKNILKRIVD